MSAAGDSCGYAGPSYVASLTHMGAPIALPRSQGWCLTRSVPGLSDADVVGPYPLFTCRDWSGLAADVAALQERAVSIVLVTDPFATITQSSLRDAFPDVCRPYKRHYIVDLCERRRDALHAHHRRLVRYALRDTRVEVATGAPAWGDDWIRLYGHLVRRHGITGAAAFSADALAAQLTLPGMVAARAVANGHAVGMSLWAVQGDYAYYHLSAYDDVGYELRASYALFSTAFDWLWQQGVRFVALGAGAGVQGSSAGLDDFKRRWATDVAPVYLCGRILQPDRYAAACGAAGKPSTNEFFPAYRAPSCASIGIGNRS